MHQTQHVSRADHDKSWVKRGQFLAGPRTPSTDFVPAPFLPTHEQEDDRKAPRNLETSYTNQYYAPLRGTLSVYHSIPTSISNPKKWLMDPSASLDPRDWSSMTTGEGFFGTMKKDLQHEYEKMRRFNKKPFNPESGDLVSDYTAMTDAQPIQSTCIVQTSNRPRINKTKALGDKEHLVGVLHSTFRASANFPRIPEHSKTKKKPVERSIVGTIVSDTTSSGAPLVAGLAIFLKGEGEARGRGRELGASLPFPECADPGGRRSSIFGSSPLCCSPRGGHSRTEANSNRLQGARDRSASPANRSPALSPTSTASHLQHVNYTEGHRAPWPDVLVTRQTGGRSRTPYSPGLPAPRTFSTPGPERCDPPPPASPPSSLSPGGGGSRSRGGRSIRRKRKVPWRAR